jgi:hypothetical protein
LARELIELAEKPGRRETPRDMQEQPAGLDGLRQECSGARPAILTDTGQEVLPGCGHWSLAGK